MNSVNRLLVRFWNGAEPESDEMDEMTATAVECQKYRCGYMNLPEARYCALCGQPLRKAVA